MPLLGLSFTLTKRGHCGTYWRRSSALFDIAYGGYLMRTLDLAPLFRASVGFDNLTRVLEASARHDNAQASYPPYNIAKASDDDYRITFAVAGFGEDDIDVMIENNSLTVTGKSEHDEDEDVSYLHRGIAGRSFQRRFQLADHIQVTSATMEKGLLHIDLKRVVPEALKPKRIEIAAATRPKVIESSVTQEAA